MKFRTNSEKWIKLLVIQPVDYQSIIIIFFWFTYYWIYVKITQIIPMTRQTTDTFWTYSWAVFAVWTRSWRNSWIRTIKTKRTSYTIHCSSLVCVVASLTRDWCGKIHCWACMTQKTWLARHLSMFRIWTSCTGNPFSL